MPGAVVSATVTAVMPFALCTKFSRSIQYKSIRSDYANGESQVVALVGSTRNTWDTAVRLDATHLDAMRAFYVSQLGRQKPFYFYDMSEHGVVYDASGVLTNGRHPVCFSSGWSDSLGVGRGDASLSLIEIA